MIKSVKMRLLEGILGYLRWHNVIQECLIECFFKEWHILTIKHVLLRPISTELWSMGEVCCILEMIVKLAEIGI